MRCFHLIKLWQLNDLTPAAIAGLSSSPSWVSLRQPPCTQLRVKQQRDLSGALKSTLREPEPELRGLRGSSGSASAASSSNCRFAIRRRQSSSVAKASKNYHKLYLFLALIGVERQSTALRIVLHAHCITPASFAEATSVLEISGPQAEVVIPSFYPLPLSMMKILR